MLRRPAATRSPRDSGTRGLPDLWATAKRGKVACGGEGCLKALSHCRQAAIRAESNMDVGFAWMLLSVVAHTTNAAARPQVDYDYVIENNQTDGDSSTQCLFDGTTYADGDEWQPDPCTTCKCLLGNSVCDSEQCPRLECRDQYVPLGQCCPVCTGDSREVLQPVTEDPETPEPTHGAASPEPLPYPEYPVFPGPRGPPGEHGSPGRPGERGAHLTADKSCQHRFQVPYLATLPRSFEDLGGSCQAKPGAAASTVTQETQAAPPKEYRVMD
nr:collagen alpha-1(I) chain-like [Rhipicephalus microplus]